MLLFSQSLLSWVLTSYDSFTWVVPHPQIQQTKLSHLSRKCVPSAVPHFMAILQSPQLKLLPQLEISDLTSFLSLSAYVWFVTKSCQARIWKTRAFLSLPIHFYSSLHLVFELVSLPPITCFLASGILSMGTVEQILQSFTCVTRKKGTCFTGRDKW